MQLTPLGTRSLTLVANRGAASLAPVLGVGPTGATGAPGPQGPNGPTLPADQMAQLVPRWQPNTAYAVGDKVMAPDGSIVERTVAGTSGATYSGTNWKPATGLTNTFALKADLPAQVDAATKRPDFYYLDAYNEFFGGAANDFVTGQATATTTTTAAVAAGATVIPVADATGLLVDTVLLLNGATANQQLVRVGSVSGNNVTLAAGQTVGTALASGAVVAPLWVNSAHLTTAGYNAYAYWVLHHLDKLGAPVISLTAGERITFLGNSWMDSKSAWSDQTLAMFPTAVVTNVGVSGNTSANLLARFDTDVPTNSKYVVMNEPGVNDILTAVDPSTVASNLLALAAKARAIGATPVMTGIVPLADYPSASAERSKQVLALTAPGKLGPDVFGATAPSVTTNVHFGPASQGLTPTGTKNTGVGSNNQKALTTGSNNTSSGESALLSLTTGGSHVAVGVDALRQALTSLGCVAVGYQSLRNSTGNDCTALGAQAMFSLTTGASNTAIGRSAGYGPAGNAANATTTATKQTLVGRNTGQSSATQVDSITCIGDSAIAGGTKATAIGANANAGHANSVALGSDTVTTAADQVMMGPRHLAVTEVTDPGVAATNGARLYAVDNGAGKTQLVVRFQSGAGIVLATEA